MLTECQDGRYRGDSRHTQIEHVTEVPQGVRSPARGHRGAQCDEAASAGETGNRGRAAVALSGGLGPMSAQALYRPGDLVTSGAIDRGRCRWLLS